MITLIKGKKN